VLEPVLDDKPRGFSGRPVVALIFAVGTGYLAAQLAVPIIIGSVVGLVGYFWYKTERPK
jgi:hypothetical protein